MTKIHPGRKFTRAQIAHMNEALDSPLGYVHMSIDLKIAFTFALN